MTKYKMIEPLNEGDVVQYVGVYALRWSEIYRATGIKATVGFVEIEDPKPAPDVALVGAAGKIRAALISNAAPTDVIYALKQKGEEYVSLSPSLLISLINALAALEKGETTKPAPDMAGLVEGIKEAIHLMKNEFLPCINNDCECRKGFGLCSQCKEAIYSFVVKYEPILAAHKPEVGK